MNNLGSLYAIVNCRNGDVERRLVHGLTLEERLVIGAHWNLCADLLSKHRRRIQDIEQEQQLASYKDKQTGGVNGGFFATNIEDIYYSDLEESMGYQGEYGGTYTYGGG